MFFRNDYNYLNNLLDGIENKRFDVEIFSSYNEINFKIIGYSR